MMHVNIYMISFLLLFGITGCCCKQEFKINHPPSFTEIIAKYPISDDMEEWDYLKKLKKAINYSAHDIEIIKDYNNSTYILGAIIQEDDLFIRNNLLSEITPEILTKNEKMIYYQELFRTFFRKNIYEDVPPSNLIQQIDNLLLLDSDNSYPYYIYAIIYCKVKNNYNLLPDFFKKGNISNKYSDYSKEKYRILIKTSMFLGYSSFSAKYHAYKTLSDSLDDLKLFNEACKKDIMHKVDNVCLNTGILIEKGGVFWVDKKFGLVIQLTSSNRKKKLVSKIKIFDKKFYTILQLQLGNKERSLADLTEYQYESLIDDIFRLGELTAYEKYFAEFF